MGPSTCRRLAGGSFYVPGPELADIGHGEFDTGNLDPSGIAISIPDWALLQLAHDVSEHL